MTAEITTFLLDKTQKQQLEAIADFNHTTVSEILRTCALLFLADTDFQHRILTETKR